MLLLPYPEIPYEFEAIRPKPGLRYWPRLGGRAKKFVDSVDLSCLPLSLTGGFTVSNGILHIFARSSLYPVNGMELIEITYDGKEATFDKFRSTRSLKTALGIGFSLITMQDLSTDIAARIEKERAWEERYQHLQSLNVENWTATRDSIPLLKEGPWELEEKYGNELPVFGWENPINCRDDETLRTEAYLMGADVVALYKIQEASAKRMHSRSKGWPAAFDNFPYENLVDFTGLEEALKRIDTTLPPKEVQKLRQNVERDTNRFPKE